MVFGTPLALTLFAVAIPIILFYILKVRLRRVPVSTNLFWRQIYDEKPPRSIWQYLRHLLSLLAQLLLVTLLVLALADPYFAGELLKTRRVVVVIDNSASMRSTDVPPSRFDAAREAALATVDGLRFRDEMAVVLAGPETEVVIGMTGHIPTLKRALRSIAVSDNPTRLGPAIELAKRLTSDHPHGQVLVFTDGCGAHDDTNSPPRPDESRPARQSAAQEGGPGSPFAPEIIYRVSGTPDACNVGITQFQVRRSLIDPLGYVVLVVVRNASSHSVRGRLELELDGAAVDVLPFELEPEGVFRRSLEKTSLAGGTLVASLTDIRRDNKDSASSQKGASDTIHSATALNTLAVDDRAWAVLPPRQIQDVLLVTPGNLFLQKVFEAHQLVRLTVVDDFPESWPSDTLVILHCRIPQQLPDGQLFVVDPLDDCDAWKLGEPITNPIVTEQDEDSPLMTHVRLDNVLMPTARKLEFTQAPHVLAQTVSGNPVYAEVKRQNGRCLVLPVDINEGDLAFRTAFPIMVANSLGWFSGRSGELRPSLATGSMTQVDLPNEEGALQGPFRLVTPSGDAIALHSRGSFAPPQGTAGAEAIAAQQAPYLAIPPLTQCGLWRVTAADSPEGVEPIAQLAVNLADDAETDVRTPPELVEKNNSIRAGDRLTKPIWFYLTAFACLFALIEWRLHQRRILT